MHVGCVAISNGDFDTLVGHAAASNKVPREKTQKNKAGTLGTVGIFAPGMRNNTRHGTLNVTYLTV